MREIIVYSDGSADNKNQDAGGGVGIVMLYEGHVKEISEGFEGPCTSAQMEIMGAIRTLEILKPGYKITVHIDNQYVVYTVEKGWLNDWLRKGILDTKANSELWLRFREAYKKHGGNKNVKFMWVKGHAGHVWNERVDRLANEGRIKLKVNESNKTIREDSRV